MIESPEMWVALAVSRDDAAKWPGVRYLHAKGGKMLATDGYRIHMCSTQFPDGVYDPDTFELLDGVNQFNAFSSAIKVTDEKFYLPVDVLHTEKLYEVSPTAGDNVVNWGGVRMNGKYWHDAIDHGRDVRVSAVTSSLSLKVSGLSSLGEFVIMGLLGQ